jgi:hypothetical protein
VFTPEIGVYAPPYIEITSVATLAGGVGAAEVGIWEYPKEMQNNENNKVIFFIIIKFKLSTKFSKVF